MRSGSRVFAIAVLAGLALVAGFVSLRPTRVPDQDLITHFSVVRPSLDRLRTMLAAESRVTGVSRDGAAIDHEVALPEEERAYLPAGRRLAYDHLLARAHIQSVARRRDGAIEFRPRVGQGQKGFVWSTEELEPALETLDHLPDARTADEADYRAYRRIAPDWYLQFQHGRSH